MCAVLNISPKTYYKYRNKEDSDKLNKVWDTDVTYLIFKGSRAYLSTIIDLCDRHVVSYIISKRNDLKLVMNTLNQALAKEKDVHGLIIHIPIYIL